MKSHSERILLRTFLFGLALVVISRAVGLDSARAGSAKNSSTRNAKSVASAKIDKNSQDQAVLTIRGMGIDKIFTRADLLNSKSLRTLEVAEDPAYDNRKMTYWAVPLTELVKDVDLSKVASMSFRCTDGFSGGISKARVFNQEASGSIAYLAIEKSDQPWPRMKEDKPETAGPFYLIWDSPEKSKILVDEWPRNLAGFELSEISFAQQYPNTLPNEKLSATDPIRRGHELFMTNCFVCHSFNGEGVGKIGPDLSFPHSPSEYMHRKYFSVLVRNPQDLRKWDQARMPGFPPTVLSDKDIQDIWSYMEHMRDRRIK